MAIYRVDCARTYTTKSVWVEANSESDAINKAKEENNWQKYPVDFIPEITYIANKLDIKPKIVVKYIKPQAVKLHSRVAISQLEMQYYCHDKLRKEAIEGVYNGILREMKANDLVAISQCTDIYTGNTIYVGTCEIYKKK